MKAKDFHFRSVKESPSEAEISSHKLLIRAGMTRKIGSGIYVLLPLGLLVLQKIEKIAFLKCRILTPQETASEVPSGGQFYATR